MKKIYIAIAATIMASTCIFFACSKEENSDTINIQDKSLETESIRYDFVGDCTTSRAINIIIGKKRKDGSCKPCWGICKLEFGSKANIEECKKFQESFGFIGIRENETNIFINYAFVDDFMTEIIHENIINATPIEISEDIIVDNEEFLSSLNLTDRFVIPKGYYTPEPFFEEQFICIKTPFILAK